MTFSSCWPCWIEASVRYLTVRVRFGPINKWKKHKTRVDGAMETTRIFFFLLFVIDGLLTHMQPLIEPSQFSPPFRCY